MATLNLITENYPHRIVSVGRELTKIFEEVITDKVENIIKHFAENPIKGEIVVIIHASKDKTEIENLSNEINTLKVKGFSDKDISVIISSLYNVNKNDVYKWLLGKM